MKQKIWFRFSFLCIFLFTANLSFHLVLSAAPKPVSSEQGEEVYDPKSHGESVKKLASKTPPPIQANTAPAQPQPQSTPEAEAPTTDEGGFKFATDTENADHATEKAQNSKNQLKGFLQKDGAKNNKEPSDRLNSQEEVKIEADKDIKVEANKLVDVDEKVIETKKYNGIIWFIAVFAVLFIVVFAFT